MYKCPQKIAVLVVIALVAACQPLPLPFQPAQLKKEGNPLLLLPDRAGVLVRPVVGLPGEIASELSRAVVASLLLQNIPAYTNAGNRESLILSGFVKNRGDKQEIVWNLFHADMTSGKSENFFSDAPPANSSPDSSSALLFTANRVALAAAASIQNPAVRDRKASWKESHIYVTAVSGAPKEAAAVLRLELQTALRREAFIVSDKLRTDSLIVQGTVSSSDSSEGEMQISVNWILSENGGRKLANLDQANDVAPIELDRDWPKIARNIAGSAAVALRRLLRGLQWRVIEHNADGI